MERRLRVQYATAAMSVVISRLDKVTLCNAVGGRQPEPTNSPGQGPFGAALLLAAKLKPMDQFQNGIRGFDHPRRSINTHARPPAYLG